MLFKNAYFRPGTFFTTRCYWCGSIVSIFSENQILNLKLEKNLEEFNNEDDNIISLSL